MREPADLQTAMYYAQAYEQRAIAMQQVYAQRGSARPALRPAPTPTASPRSTPTAAPTGPPASTRPFKRLTSAEQLERRRQGLCFNCDEKYAPGHTCARLFYLETVDDADSPPSSQPPPSRRPVSRPTRRSTRPPSSSLFTLWRASRRQRR